MIVLETPEEWLSLHEVMDVTHCGYQAVIGYIRRGLLSSVKIRGAGHLVHRDVVQAFLNGEELPPREVNDAAWVRASRLRAERRPETEVRRQEQLAGVKARRQEAEAESKARTPRTMLRVRTAQSAARSRPRAHKYGPAQRVAHELLLADFHERDVLGMLEEAFERGRTYERSMFSSTIDALVDQLGVNDRPPSVQKSRG